MCITAKKAKETNNPKSQESEQYRNFIFFFATTLVHELAHLFVTFLSLGDSNTPPELVPKLSGIHKRDYAESGNYLEELLFGGSVVFQYDNDYDQHQVCLCMHGLMEDFECKLTHVLARFTSPSRRERSWSDLAAGSR